MSLSRSIPVLAIALIAAAVAFFSFSQTDEGEATPLTNPGTTATAPSPSEVESLDAPTRPEEGEVLEGRTDPQEETRTAVEPTDVATDATFRQRYAKLETQDLLTEFARVQQLIYEKTGEAPTESLALLNEATSFKNPPQVDPATLERNAKQAEQLRAEARWLERYIEARVGDEMNAGDRADTGDVVLDELLRDHAGGAR
ncbi:MAG: hypothetical protein GY711_17165 [bacterium]|nr:hypothetical protein [bacterium]